MTDLGGLGLLDGVGDDGVLAFELFLDNLLPEDLCFLDDNSSPLPNPSADGASASLSIGEIEKLLLVDDLEDHPNHSHSLPATDAFLSDLILDSPPPPVDFEPDSSISPSTSHNHDVDLDNSKNSSPSKPRDNDNLVPHQEDNHVDDDNNPLAKKRKRQLRNRDAAVRSRERKKIYVRDLEMKSRFYEAECRRLGMLLQCCLAENHALRYSLHNNGQAFGASTTRQESAVLLLESLLMGSLLWLLGIIGLLILPRQFLSILKAAPQENVGEKSLESLAPRKAGSNMFRILEFKSFMMMSKRWRGSRTRMKVLYQ